MKTERDPRTGCELWLGSQNSNGYGTDWSSGRPRMAHYKAWEDAHGPVPKDKVVDHVCRRRLCVALAHLELVSQSENLRRRGWSHRSQREWCPKGHDLETNGRRTPEGGVVCRVCSGVAPLAPNSRKRPTKTLEKP